MEEGKEVEIPQAKEELKEQEEPKETGLPELRPWPRTPTYWLRVESLISAGHRLPNYSGPCRVAHGHNWLIQSVYRVEKLDAQGMAIDLVILKNILRNVLAKYDHRTLNAQMDNVPTSENLARVVFKRLQQEPCGEYLRMVAVKETPDCKVWYTEGKD